MSLLDKQNQNVGDGSTAHLAGRDIIHNTYYGLRDHEVASLVQELLQNNFPRLVNDAKEAVERNIEEFNAKLHQTLEKRFQDLNFDKLSDPDVQADFNQAINNAARKGKKSNLDLLTEILSNRLLNNSSDIFDQVCSDAINIIPKLTKQQLDFLAISFYLQHYKSPNIETFSDLEFDVNKLNKFYLSIENMSDASRYLLLSYGLCLHNTSFSLDTFHVIAKSKKLSDYEEGSGESKDFYIHNAPETYELLKIYDEQDGINYTITTVGDLIAIIHLNNEAPHLNIKIEEWIN